MCEKVTMKILLINSGFYPNAVKFNKALSKLAEVDMLDLSQGISSTNYDIQTENPNNLVNIDAGIDATKYDFVFGLDHGCMGAVRHVCRGIWVW